MKDKFFSDSNVLLYLLDKDEFKKAKAEEILFSNPLISTQVINENINVAYKQFHLSKPVAKLRKALYEIQSPSHGNSNHHACLLSSRWTRSEKRRSIV